MQGNKMENLNLNNKSVNVYLESGNIPVYLFQVILKCIIDIIIFSRR